MLLSILIIRKVRIIILILILNTFSSTGLTARTDPIDSTKTMSYVINSKTTLVYSRPKPFEFIKVIPRDYGAFCKTVFRKDQIIHIAEIAGETALLIALDQQILDDAQNFGRTIHLAGTSNQTTLINKSVTISNKEIKLQFNVPTDVNSTFYYLGDGWTHTTLAISFWISGLISKDFRSLRIASELGECILTTGIATQFLKHITGRQSPYTTSVKGGTWHFFPNQKQYADHVPEHDAFPTGHLATAMATVTVIADNYPEHKFIRPLGYSLMSLLGFAMLNNGVHWAGDYPVGIALGYVFAKVAVNHGRVIHSTDHSTSLSKNRWKFSPSVTFVSNEFVGSGLGIRWSVVNRNQSAQQ